MKRTVYVEPGGRFQGSAFVTVDTNPSYGDWFIVAINGESLG